MGTRVGRRQGVVCWIWFYSGGVCAPAAGTRRAGGVSHDGRRVSGGAGGRCRTGGRGGRGPAPASAGGGANGRRRGGVRRATRGAAPPGGGTTPARGHAGDRGVLKDGFGGGRWGLSPSRHTRCQVNAAARKHCPSLLSTPKQADYRSCKGNKNKKQRQWRATSQAERLRPNGRSPHSQ